jgi:hypothetical protein
MSEGGALELRERRRVEVSAVVAGVVLALL